MAIGMNVTEVAYGLYISFTSTGVPLPVPTIDQTQSLEIVGLAVGSTGATTGVFTINDGGGNLLFLSSPTTSGALTYLPVSGPVRVTGLQIGCSVAAATQGFVIVYFQAPV